jgi:predicted ATP-grasp superfamily ATP-dependent carboligase
VAEGAELEPIEGLNDPVLIAAFAIQRRAGRLAVRTIDHLIEQWGARRIGHLDAQPFCDFTVRRPYVSWARDSIKLDWPEATFYLARPEGASQDIILLSGFEPNFRWRTYAEQVASAMDRIGVKTLVNLRALPGAVPHTRPAPVYINASDIELELRFGVQSRGSKYEGPTDVGGVLAAHVQTLRWQTIDLSVLQPEYFPRLPNAEASLSLIRLLDEAFGTKTPTAALEETAESQRNAIDESVRDDLQTMATIETLEQTFDAALDRLDFLAPGRSQRAALPSGEDLLDEVERFLRQGGSTRDASQE